MERKLLLTLSILAAAGRISAQDLGWSSVPMMGTRSGAMMAYDAGRDRVVVFGGTYCNASDSRNDTWEWDGRRWRECTPRTRAAGCRDGAMAYDSVRHSILLLGGWGYRGNPFPFPNDLWEWDGQDWRIVPVLNMPPSRYQFGLASDPVRHRVVLFGGTRGFFASDVRNDTWEWDGTQWTEKHPATVPAPRLKMSMAWCGANARILMYGGIDGLGFCVDPAWEWDGTDWTQLQATGPGLRELPVSCEMPWNGHVLLHGGVTATPATGYLSTDTWEWDGAAWTNVQPADHPGAREWPMMAPHASTGTVIYYGGLFTGTRGASRIPSADPGDRQDSVWGFRNQNWQRLPGNEVPQESFEFALQDSAHDQTLLMGSTYDLQTGRATWATWALQGDSLRELPGASPPWRWYPARGYHAALGKAVMVGGRLDGFPLTDTWVWDGTHWSEDTTTVLPSDKAPSISYDPDRQALVLVLQGSNDIYEWRGHGWTVRPEAQLPFPLTWNRGFLSSYDVARHRLVLVYGDLNVPLQTWEFVGSQWQLISMTAPFLGDSASELVYVPELGGVMAVNFDHPDQVWLWDGATWSQLTISDPLWDGLRITTYVHLLWPVYDAARGVVRTIQPNVCASRGNSQAGSIVWNLELRILDVDSRLPKLGQAITFSVDDGGPSGLAVILLSDATWPGIPVPGLGERRVPLAYGPLLQASLGSVFAVLDGQGRGSATLAPIPINASLVGLTLRTAGIVLGQAGVQRITNEVCLEVQR